jgi:hypothetical protein
VGAVEVRLQPLALEVVGGIYRDLVRECRRRGVLAVWVYLPMPGVSGARVPSAALVKVAREAGFLVVDLSDWAEEHDPSEIRVSDTDRVHANALGHRVIAERLLREGRARPELTAGRR